MPDIRYDDIREIDLKNGLLIENSIAIMATSEMGSHRFGAKLKSGGASVTLPQAATVEATFIRPDGVTVRLEGTASGDTAYVDIPAECLYYGGAFRLTIFVYAGTAYLAVRVIDGTIILSESQSVLDDGGTYSLDALMELLDGKLTKPATDGEDGNVLTSDGQGGTEWRDPSTSTVAGTVKVDSTSLPVRTGTAGASGYLTFVLEE